MSRDERIQSLVAVAGSAVAGAHAVVGSAVVGSAVAGAPAGAVSNLADHLPELAARAAVCGRPDAHAQQLPARTD